MFISDFKLIHHIMLKPSALNIILVLLIFYSFHDCMKFCARFCLFLVSEIQLHKAQISYIY